MGGGHHGNGLHGRAAVAVVVGSGAVVVVVTGGRQSKVPSESTSVMPIDEMVTLAATSSVRILARSDSRWVRAGS